MLLAGLASIFLANLVSADTLIDLSHDLAADSMKWPVAGLFAKTEVVKGFQDTGHWFEYYDMKFAEHITTHMDSPSHFVPRGRTVDQIPLSNLIGPAIKIDISEKVKTDSLASLNVTDIERWIEKNGPIPDNAIVFVRTGWGSKYGNPVEYFGTNNFDDIKTLKFPGIGLDAAQFLTRYRGATGNRIVGVGLDVASLDKGDAIGFPAHTELLGNDIYGLESVANLELLPETGAEVTVLPLKTRGGSGGPTRIVARIPTKRH